MLQMLDDDDDDHHHDHYYRHYLVAVAKAETEFLLVDPIMVVRRRPRWSIAWFGDIIVAKPSTCRSYYHFY